MPHIVKANPSGKTEKQTKLGAVRPGEIFRFPSATLEQALAGEEGAGFYQVIETQPKKAGRVTIVSIDGKSVQEKDDDHKVIVHPATLEIGEAELV
jgi:hypothetical protein